MVCLFIEHFLLHTHYGLNFISSLRSKSLEVQFSEAALATSHSNPRNVFSYSIPHISDGSYNGKKNDLRTAPPTILSYRNDYAVF